MTNIKLDDIPDLVKSNKLSSQQACIQIYYTAYMNPARFGLLNLDEDSRSDFLLYFLQYKTQTLIENYNPKISPFGAYIYKTIQTAILTYNKKMSDKKNYDKIFFMDSFCDYQTKMEEYENSVTKIASNQESFNCKNQIKIKTHELQNSKNENFVIPLVFKQLFTKAPHRLTITDSHQRKLKRGLLILALKSAWYISDSQIQKVSKICSIPPDVLTESVCHLKSKLITKALNRQTIENNRNRAYCFIHNYRMQLENLDTNHDYLKSNKLKKKLDFHIANWEKKTKFLSNGRLKIAPSNSEIASVVGLSSRFVSFYMRKLQEMDIQSIQKIL